MSKFLGTIVDGEVVDGKSIKRASTLFSGAFGIVIRDGKVALIYSSTDSHHELPGGRAEDDETPTQAFKREIMEELGYAIKDITEIAQLKEVRTADGFETIAHFMIANAYGELKQVKYTEAEIKRGFSIKWVDIDDLPGIIASEAPQAVAGKIKHRRDSLSLAEFSKRTDIYASYFSSNNIVTPQSTLRLTENYVVDSFSKNGQLTTRGKHSLATKKWLLTLRPDADEVMQIAAVAHDIDGAFNKYDFKGEYRDASYLLMHQQAASDVLGKFLTSINANSGLVARAKHLVEKHEVGGDDDQNIIKDADSLGFFDRDLPDFIARHSANGADKTQLKEKFDWMFDRITSPTAKEFAKPMYDEAIRLLEAK